LPFHHYNDPHALICFFSFTPFFSPSMLFVWLFSVVRAIK